MTDGEPIAPLRFEGDNSFPDCAGCGRCCEGIFVLACTPDEVQTMAEYVWAHDITLIDYQRTRCCFQAPDRKCMIWPARPQVCRLHHCQVPRTEILRQNPSIQVPEDIPLIDLYDAFFEGDLSDPRYRKKRGGCLGKVLAAFLLLLITAAVAGYFYLSYYYYDLGHPMTIEEATQLIQTGGLEHRTVVAQPLSSYATDRPALSYADLYEKGSQEYVLYQAITGSVTEFQSFDRDQQLTWAETGIDLGNQEQATLVSTLFKQVLNDHPCYTVQYPSTPVNATEQGSHAVVTAGTRFMLRSLYLQPTTEEALGYYQQVVDRVDELHSQILAACDGTQYGYIKTCFSTLASGMVYSDAGDDGPWYANNIYGALFGGESECVGMSCAMKALLDAQGIPNFIATGKMTESGTGHAWNVVYYDGQWYCCDLTRCVGDVVSVDEDGTTTRTEWHRGDVPQLDDEMDALAAGFMVSQDTFVSGDPVVNAEGTREYSFGGGIDVDDACYLLESTYEKAL